MTLQDGTVTDGEFVFVEPGIVFDELYVALDPNDVDGSDKVRINNIAILEQQASDDMVLSFAINSDDGDGDQSPAAEIDQSDPESYPGYFEVTVLGNGTGTAGDSLIFV